MSTLSNITFLCLSDLHNKVKLKVSLVSLQALSFKFE